MVKTENLIRYGVNEDSYKQLVSTVQCTSEFCNEKNVEGINEDGYEYSAWVEINPTIKQYRIDDIDRIKIRVKARMINRALHEAIMLRGVAKHDTAFYGIKISDLLLLSLLNRLTYIRNKQDLGVYNWALKDFHRRMFKCDKVCDRILKQIPKEYKELDNNSSKLGVNRLYNVFKHVSDVTGYIEGENILVLSKNIRDLGYNMRVADGIIKGEYRTKRIEADYTMEDYRNDIWKLADIAFNSIVELINNFNKVTNEV